MLVLKLMKPILFIDFDGTLCQDRFWRSLPRDEYTKVQELLFGADKSVIDKWMVGDTTSEDVNKLVSEHLEKPFEDVWQSFVFDCQTMQVGQHILETIAKLRGKYVTILLTVNMDCFSRFTAPALHLEEYFDEISNSYYSKMTKTDNDGEIYKNHAEKRNVQLTECVTIDDSISACSTFEKLGGKSYLVTPEANISTHLSRLIKF